MRQPHTQRQPNAPLSAVTSPPVPPSVTPLRREVPLENLSCDEGPFNGERRRQKPFGVTKRFLEKLRKSKFGVIDEIKVFLFPLLFSYHHLLVLFINDQTLF
jgi:hypothetical protein